MTIDQWHTELERFVEKVAKGAITKWPDVDRERWTTEARELEARELIARRPVEAKEANGERWYISHGDGSASDVYGVWRYTDAGGTYWGNLSNAVTAWDGEQHPRHTLCTRSAAIAQIESWGWPVPEEVK